MPIQWNIPSQAAQVAPGAHGLEKNPVARAGAPIALTSELGAVAAGSTANFPTIGLQPGLRTPYWIDEVHISVGSDATVPSNALPAALRLFFETGSYKVSKFPIPAPSFAQIYGRDEYDEGQTLEFVNFRWILSKPLYMPAGDILQCRIERDATLASGVSMTNLCLSYHGRACAPGDAPPAVRHIPWVTYIQFPQDKTYMETNDEFRNPFLKPLQVQRLIARIVDRGIDPNDQTLMRLIGPTNDYSGLAHYPTQYMLPTQPLAGQFVSVKILDSLGYMIVPNMTPLGAVIDPGRSAWTFNRALSAREQLAIAFQTTRDATQPRYFDTFVSMVGCREENV